MTERYIIIKSHYISLLHDTFMGRARSPGFFPICATDIFIDT